MNLSEYAQALKIHRDFGQAFVDHRYTPPVDPAFGELPDLDPPLRDLLTGQGIQRLYTHQVAALSALRQGRNVLVSTPTASGKSLIYILAVLEEIALHPTATALCLFPLKALAQDQRKTLGPWISEFGRHGLTAEIYDGDTSPYHRKRIRGANPGILITNPDMLHRGLLAYPEHWERFLGSLAYVVLDEVHAYRGIFGSHVNQVLRRLRRVCRHLGSDPRFILLSATVSNPKEFGEKLVEVPVEVIDLEGAPRAGQHFLCFNPPESGNFFAAKLFKECVTRGLRTIVFTQSRKITELIHLWISKLAPAFRERISSYRAGFLPEERREIERRLASGDLMGVVSTSALEMGIDIGSLDVCLLVGYPGTIMNTWQRGGRVGRSGRESMILLLAKPDALDQYFMRHPEELFSRSYEAAVLDPHNPTVVRAHLPCAAREIPLSLEDAAFWPEDLPGHLETLEQEGRLYRTAEGEPLWFCGRKSPHLEVDLRASGETFTIFEEGNSRVIGTVDGIKAFKECHAGAVYLHRARQYLVDRLDLEKRNIFAHSSDLRYFTRPRAEKETEILRISRSRPRRQFVVREGTLKVTETIVAYEKRGVHGQELLGVFPLELPPQRFETVGFWVEIAPRIRAFVEKKGLHFMGGIHAIEHAAIGIFPLFALCDRNDIGGISYPHHPQVGSSAVFLYDGVAGGVGLASRGFEVIVELLERALDVVGSCPCEEGCPSCIHSPKCGSGNKPLDKAAAILLLEALLGHIPLSAMEEAEDRERPGTRTPQETQAPAQAPEPRPRIVYVDLETQKLAEDVGGWQNIHLMGVSVGVVYDGLEERFQTFFEEEVASLVATLERADLVVGFNIKSFDYRVLRAYTSARLEDLPTFDILEDIHKRLGFRLTLDHLAEETLNRNKTADGIQAVSWFREGRMEELAAYCREDVALTRDLFLHGVREGHLVYRDKRTGSRLRLLVDWRPEDWVAPGKAPMPAGLHMAGRG